jgi:hypothetical protein
MLGSAGVAGVLSVSPVVTHAGSIAPSDIVHPPAFLAVQNDVTYVLEFRARTDDAFGHAFMVIEAIDRRGNIDRAGIFGFGTATGAPDGLFSLFGSIGEIGYTTDDINAHLTETFRVPLSRTTYRQLTQSVTDARSSWTVYGLLFLNCNTFIGAIARSIGLHAPENSALLPADFVRELKRLNATDKPIRSAG